MKEVLQKSLKWSGFFLGVLIFGLNLEIGARIIFEIKSIKELISRQNSDVKWRYAWLDRHKYGKRTPIYYDFDRYDPLLGWGLIPGLSKKKCFGSEYISSNSKGIRGDREYPYSKSDKLRILFLGDSFTFGDEVSDNETYPHYLQELLPDAEIINMGVHGYGHDQMLLYLKQEGIKYKPDIIILGYMSCDEDRNVLSFRDYAKPKFEIVRGKLKLTHVPVPSPETTLAQGPWRSRFVDLLGALSFAFEEKTGYYDAQKKALTKALLAEIAGTAKDMGAVPVYVQLSFVRDKSLSPYVEAEESLFAQQSEKLGAKSFSPRAYVHEQRLKGTKIKERGHFDPETNNMIARSLKDFLEKNNLLHGFSKKAIP